MLINGLIRKIRLISKFMRSQPGSQTVSIHILTNIWSRKFNQAMKFVQLIQYNLRNIFSCTQNASEILFPGPFLKNEN